jgi:hypothetical protein
MTESKNAKTPIDGGPAFPKLTQDERWKTFTSTDGMSLRDYFAGKAMQALAQGNYFDATARQAYMIADAMLKAREA